MRIKKLIALALCVCLSVLALVSCEQPIGAYRDKYTWEEKKVPNLVFDLYVIVGEGTDDMAMKTVNDQINQYLIDKYHTKLNIHYIAESEYAAKAAEAVTSHAAVTTDYVTTFKDFENKWFNGGKIVLVNGVDMMNDIVASGKAYDKMADFLTTNAFGKLNVQIPEPLIEAAKIDGKLYAIPNNHVIGQYEYIVIHRETALALNYSDVTELPAMTTYDSTAELRRDIDANSAQLGKSSDDAVKTVVGNYELRYQWEADGYVCNVAKNPQATAEEALSSAYAILPGNALRYVEDTNADGTLSAEEIQANKDLYETTDNETLKSKINLADSEEIARRAMEVVYAINADVTVRNLLQYGVAYTNYRFVDTDGDGDGDTVDRITEEGSEYNMPIKHTGNVFNAYYCNDAWNADNKWTVDMKTYGALQNEDAE